MLMMYPQHLTEYLTNDKELYWLHLLK